MLPSVHGFVIQKKTVEGAVETDVIARMWNSMDEFESESAMEQYMKTGRSEDYNISKFKPGETGFFQEAHDTGLSCPAGFVKAPSKEHMEENRQNVPLKPKVSAARSTNETDETEYLFITGAAYTGTTGLLGLLSTSPASSNLCASHSICCEGGWLLKNLMQGAESRGDPRYPKDWNDALPIFEKYWDNSKKVLIDKSPNYLLKFSRLYKDLGPSGAGKKVSFVYLVSSRCAGRAAFSPDYKGQDEWAETTGQIVEEIKLLKDMGARVHIVKSEEMLGEPFKVRQRLLDWMPVLESLDPTQSGVHDAPYVKEGDSRASSLYEFCTRAGAMSGIKEMALSAREADLMEELGYTKQWFSKSPFVEKT